MWAENLEVNCKQPVKRIVLPCAWFRNGIALHSFVYVTDNAASEIFKVKFLDCLRRFFDGVRYLALYIISISLTKCLCWSLILTS